MSGGRTYARLSLADDRIVWAQIEGDRADLLDAAPWEDGARTQASVAWPVESGARLVAPAAPRKILCVGRNYKAHAAELGNDVPKDPLLFLKPSSSLLDPGGAVVLPPESVSTRVDHEAEIALVIGRRARHVSRADALAHVFGVTLAFDITARDLQKKDGQWTRAKGMDTFCPVGPVIVTGVDPRTVTFECRVDGEVRQRGDARDMIFPADELIAYASQFFTLEPGDLVLTGTPEGVSALRAGNALAMEAAGIGVLSVGVVASPP